MKNNNFCSNKNNEENGNDDENDEENKNFKEKIKESYKIISELYDRVLEVRDNSENSIKKKNGLDNGGMNFINKNLVKNEYKKVY